MKVYTDKDVLTSFFERANYIFDEFELIYLSVSGGKDSSVMVQLFDKVARERGKTYDVLFLDLEAQYEATLQHIEELKNLPSVRNFYHLALPLSLTNASSILQPKWVCWSEADKEKWIRDMPEDAINMNNHHFGDFFHCEMEFEQMIKTFPRWLMEKHGTRKVAGLVGIRSDESLNRFRAIAFAKNKYKDKNWTTDNGKGSFSAYPIYDWKTQDIWGAVAKYDLLFNSVYEMLTKSGVGIHQQRICHPYGFDQRVSLNQWAVLEPKTWAKVVNRVSGTNFGNIYCKTSLLGHNGTEKPDHLNWQEYAIFLLETIGMYSPTLMKHYARKLKIYFDYYKKNYGLTIKDIPDYRSPKEAKEKGKGIHWKKIARCIERNDFACTSLSYGLTNADIEVAKQLKKEWSDNLGISSKTKVMRTLKERIS